MIGPIRLLVADEDRLVSDALGSALSRCRSMKALDEHPVTGPEFAHAVRETHPEVALISDPLADMNAPAATRTALAAQPDLKVILVAHRCQPDHVRDALAAGAVGFLPKSLDVSTVAEAIRRADAGECPVFEEQLTFLLGVLDRRSERKDEMAERLARLSPRQLEVLRLMGAGLTATQIAHYTDLKEATVRTHIQNVLGKLDVRSQVEAVTVARDLGVIR